MKMAKFNKDIEFSNRFRKLVADKGWGGLNRIELGKRLGTSSTCATFYMNGDRLPAIDQARIISKIFNVYVEWLLTGQGPMRPGEEISDPLYAEIRSLSPEHRAIIESTIAALNKTEQNHLTPELKNVGGEIIPEPSQPLQAQDRRETTLSSYHAMLRQTCKAR